MSSGIPQTDDADVLKNRNGETLNKASRYLFAKVDWLHFNALI